MLFFYDNNTIWLHVFSVWLARSAFCSNGSHFVFFILKIFIPLLVGFTVRLCVWLPWFWLTQQFTLRQWWSWYSLPCSWCWYCKESVLRYAYSIVICSLWQVYNNFFLIWLWKKEFCLCKSRLNPFLAVLSNEGKVSCSWKQW